VGEVAGLDHGQELCTPTDAGLVDQNPLVGDEAGDCRGVVRDDGALERV
jgi:hypothetical protein